MSNKQKSKSVLERLMTHDNIVILEHFWVHQEFWYTEAELKRILKGKLLTKEYDQHLLNLQTLQLLESSKKGEWCFNRESKLGRVFNEFIQELGMRNIRLMVGMQE